MVLGSEGCSVPRVTYCACLAMLRAPGNAPPRARTGLTAGRGVRASYARPHSPSEWRRWSDSGGVMSPLASNIPTGQAPSPSRGRPCAPQSRYLHHHSRGPTGVTKRDIKKSEDVVAESRNAGLETWRQLPGF